MGDNGGEECPMCNQEQLSFTFWPIERERAELLAEEAMRMLAGALMADKYFMPTVNTGPILQRFRMWLVQRLADEDACR
jgi:hypothetical protein